ncbi:MAG: glycosyltransferase family 87 protein [Thermoplasmata archaeon]
MNSAPRLRSLRDRFSQFYLRIPRTVRSVLPVLLIGVAIRLVLIPISLNTDLVTFAQTSAAMVYGQGPYSHPTVYPPFMIFYLNVVGRVTSVFTPPTAWFTTNSQLQGLFMVSSALAPTYELNLTYVWVEKLSLVVFDVAAGFVIYHLALRTTGKPATAVWAFAAWFLNPLVILLSSVHGSYDVLPTFCVLAAFVLAFDRRPFFSGLAIAVGALIGVFPFLFVPMLGAISWKQAPPGKSLWAAGGVIGGVAVPVVAVVAVPGLLSEFVQSALVGPSRAGGVYQGFGFWGFFSVPGIHSADQWISAFGGTTTVIVGAGLAVAIAVIAAAVLLRAPRGEVTQPARWLPWATLVSVGAFLIPQVVQPQYMIWCLPFLILLVPEGRRYLAIFLVVSVGPALYYFTLGGPLLNFLPLWYDFHVVPYQLYLSSINAWVQVQNVTFPLEFVPVSTAFVCLVVLLVLKLRAPADPAPTDGGPAG